MRVPRLSDRQLVINHEAWELGPDAVSYATCSDVLGCDPPADRCDRAWVDAALAGTEIPPEQQVDVLACDGNWLVLDVDAVVTGCQSVDGSTPPPGCEGSGTHTRWFAELDGDRMWQVIASGTRRGCTDVLAVAPEFPARLCSDLPPR